MHNVTDSTENYLKAIYVMSKKTGSVRSVDIARFLDVTKASVSVAMRKLREANYINMASDGMITLLPDGLTIALRTYERHVLLRAFLIHLGVDEETADKDACKIEHAISRESFEALQRHAQEIDLKTPEV
ncbi:MAG: metal-dependent transcriptional regulator [Clostridiaceae bacterium]|jgi:DtxR family Mn-dependent transcriptional regulator|nr:metal-dependent transcriptional regulator [Clostridiaceae bacterium]